MTSGLASSLNGTTLASHSRASSVSVFEVSA